MALPMSVPWLMLQRAASPSPPPSTWDLIIPTILLSYGSYGNGNTITITRALPFSIRADKLIIILML